MTFKSKLRKAINEFQPDVEEFFGLKLGYVELEPSSFYNRGRLANLFCTSLRILGFPDIEVPIAMAIPSGAIVIPSGAITIPSGSKNHKILYNDCRLFDLAPFQYVSGLAIHEMAHLGHSQRIGLEQLLKTDPHRVQCIADYVATKILGKREIDGFWTSKRLVQAEYIKGAIKTLGVNFLYYLDNYSFKCRN